jgi:DNA-binding Lrp family transcriptional regulator
MEDWKDGRMEDWDAAPHPLQSSILPIFILPIHVARSVTPVTPELLQQSLFSNSEFELNPITLPMDPLLELLHQNSNIPREDLAKMLNLPVEEVNRRIDRYEKDQVILAYQAVVDPEKIDADAVTAFIEVSITPERGGGFDRLAERIARFDEVKSCWLMSGGYDLAILVEGSNLREIARFVSEKLSTVEGVVSTATRFRLKTYKQNGMLLSQPASAERLPVTP